MAEHVGHTQVGMKQECIIASDPTRRVYRLKKEADRVALMSLIEAAGGELALACKHEGCPIRFAKPRPSTRGNWFVADMPETSGFGHPIDAESHGGGGTMSAEHGWSQEQVKAICDEQGYDSIIEDPETHSDVLVFTPDGVPVLSVEVQRWNTDFALRTTARQDHGVEVLWLITEDAKSVLATTGALAEYPAVRLLVRDRKGQRAYPWEDSSASVGIGLYATVTVAAPAPDGRLTTGDVNVSLRAFLNEVLTGAMRWHGVDGMSAPGMDRAAWIMERDRLSAVLAANPPPGPPVPATTPEHVLLNDEPAPRIPQPRYERPWAPRPRQPARKRIRAWLRRRWERLLAGT